MLQLEKDLLEIQLQVSKWQPVVRKIVNPLYGYVVCEQIISNNQSYLDTMYKPNTQTKLDIKFKLDNTEDNNICCSNDFGICVRDGKFAYMFGDTIELTDVDVADGIPYTLQLSKNGLYIDGHKVVDEFDIDTPFVSTDNLLLCAGYDNGDVSVLNSKSIYYCKVYDVDNFDHAVMEDGEMIMSVLNQVNEVDDTFDGFGGTDQEIKDNLDEVMNRRGIKHYIPDLVRNYVGARTDEESDEDYIYGFYNYADKKFYDATEGEFSGKDSKDYIELEYLQSSGTQYIDTGVNDKNGMIFECKFMLPSIYGSTWNTIVGVQDTADSDSNGSNAPLMTYSDRTKFAMYVGTANQNSNFAVATSTMYVAKACTYTGNTYLTLNGTTQTFTNTGTRGTKSIYMFGLNNGGNLGYASSSRIYYLKLTDSNGVVVRDFIPVKRKVDNVLCMYDKVSGLYFTNKGSGTFTAGPEINEDTKNINTSGLSLQFDRKSVISATQWYDRVSGKNITISNGAINSETGAITFNGSSTVIDSAVAQSTLTSGYTIIVKFYPTIWNNYKGIFGLHDTSGQNGISGLQYEGGSVYYGHRNNGNYFVSVNATNVLPLNQWHTAICRFDGTYLYLYIDGDYIGKTNNNTPLTATGNIIIGKSYNESNRFFAGQISDFIIYKRAISSDEITYLFNHIK